MTKQKNSLSDDVTDGATGHVGIEITSELITGVLVTSLMTLV